MFALETFLTFRAEEGPAVRVNVPVTEEERRVGKVEATVREG